MTSESRLISSKAVSAIHPDLGVFFFFGPSIPLPSLISPFRFPFFSLFSFWDGFVPCVSGGRWINKRTNAKCGLDRCTMEWLAKNEGRNDKCWRESLDNGWIDWNTRGKIFRFEFLLLWWRMNSMHFDLNEMIPRCLFCKFLTVTWNGDDFLFVTRILKCVKEYFMLEYFMF